MRELVATLVGYNELLTHQIENQASQIAALAARFAELV
jgi:hypothetical protein